jgi:hypothetical protein
MSILTTFIPAIVVFAIVFSAPLFHSILAAGQTVGRLALTVRDAVATQAPALAPALAAA